MKKTIAILLGLMAFIGVGVAGDMDAIPPFVFSTIATNGGTDVAQTSIAPISGRAYAIILDFTSSTTSPTCDVDVATSSSLGTGPSRTILSKDDITSDQPFYPRGLAVTTAGVDFTEDQQVLIPLSQDKIQVTISNANTTGVTAKVWFLYEHSKE